MSTKSKAVVTALCKELGERDIAKLYSFKQFLDFAAKRPEVTFRGIRQYTRDMYFYYVKKEPDEYPYDVESIGYDNYNTDKLFLEGVDEPYFVDRVMANRLARYMQSLPTHNGQNVVYDNIGPAGCGKSTCINNLLRGLERYSLIAEGDRYELVWQLDRDKIRNQSIVTITTGSSISARSKPAGATIVW